MDTKLLKQKILDLAIRGKLVPQDPNDESASVLLERIRAEKERLIREGKIKRSRGTADDKIEAPFEIPESWEWVQFGEYLDVRDGTHDTPTYVENGYPFVTSKNLSDGTIDFSNVQYISEVDYLNFSKRSYVDDGDILFAMIGSIGNPVLVRKDRDFSIKNVALFKPYSRNNTNMVFVYYFLYLFQNKLKERAKGGMQPFVPLNLFRKDLYIPIPPANEQVRIVSEIEKWFAIIDEIKLNKQDLGEAINQTKSKILDLSIHGKLVPQDHNDKPAIDLLKRINPDFTPCDDSQYEDLPSSWCVVKIGDVYSHTTGKALKKSNQEGVLRKYITTSNLYWNSFDFTEVRSMYFTDRELDKCTAKKGDLLVCNGGDVGRAAIWNRDEDICIQNHISRLRPLYDSIVNNLFYCYIFMYLKQKGNLAGKGVAITSLSASDMLSIPIPLPPINEQIRIVQKIQEINDKLQAISAEL